MLKRFGVSIPEQLLEKFDSVIKAKGYANRSEALRDLVRRLLVEEEWAEEDPHTERVGVLILVYDHEESDLSQKLTHVQHSHVHSIITTVHVHLDEHNCLEVLILKGKPSEITTLADTLIATRGVKFGKFVKATSGRELK